MEFVQTQSKIVTVTNAAFETLTAAGLARDIQFGLKRTF